MNIFHALIKILHWIYALMFGLDNKHKQKQIEVAASKDPVVVFYDDACARFKDTYVKYSALEMSANIDAAFYNLSEFKKAVELSDNELELAWRRRQLNVRTPRANVIMYYDAFKMGFAYYSDSFIPYNILNAVAMKYVIMYRCRDFFVDENVDVEKSPLIDVHTNEKKEKDTNKDNTNRFVLPKDAPMAKLKSKRVVQCGKSELNANVNMNMNRFIHLGGVRNYKPLIETKKKVNSMNGFKSDAMPTSVMTYKQYKQHGIPLM